MRDAEYNHPSKKRAAGIQLSRDNPCFDDNDESTEEQEAGTFKRASEDVLATRRIVKVRRNQTSTVSVAAATPAPSNPFTAIRLVPTAHATVTSTETEKSVESEIKSENKLDEVKDKPSAKENDEIEKQSEREVSERKIEPSAEAKDKPSAKENDEIEKQSEREVSERKIEPSAETEDKTIEANEQSKTEVVGEEGTECKSSDVSEKEAEHQVEKEVNEEDKDKGETDEKNENSASFSSFHNLTSGQTAFSGITGTGFSSTSFSIGSSTTGSLFDGLNSSPITFNFGGGSTNGSSIFGTSATNVTKSEENKFPPMQEIPLETGEENERSVFTADSVMFEFTDGTWKERGKGELKVNVSTDGNGKARLVMRSKGNYRLILNASLFPEMKLTSMDKKGITFACVNSASEGKDGLSTIALKFRDPSIVEEFCAVVLEHKDKTPVSSKTPDNSPKASEE